jgi:hypothetical protein
VDPSFLHPPIRLGIPDQVEERAQEGGPVSPPESEAGGVGRECVGERAGVVEDTLDCFRHKLRDGFGICLVPEKVRRNPRRPGDRKSMEPDPLTIIEVAHMDTDVWPPALAAAGHGEFVPISGEVAQAVHGRRRSVGHHALVSGPLPRRHLGSQLEPCGPEIPVIGGWRSDQLVDTMSHPFENSTRFDQALQRRRADPGFLDLAARDEAPLVLGKVLETWERWMSRHYSILPLIRGYMQYGYSRYAL